MYDCMDNLFALLNQLFKQFNSLFMTVWSLIIHLSAVHYTTMSSANNFVLVLMFFGRPLTYNKNSKGPNTVHEGTSQLTVNFSDYNHLFVHIALYLLNMNLKAIMLAP